MSTNCHFLASRSMPMLALCIALWTRVSHFVVCLTNLLVLQARETEYTTSYYEHYATERVLTKGKT